MSTRLVIRTGRPAARPPAKPPTLAEQISDRIDELLRLQQLAANDRRGHALTEQLLDGLFANGRAISRLGRG